MSFQSRNIRTEALLGGFHGGQGFRRIVVESILCQREPFGFRLYKQVVGKSAGYQHGQAFFFIVRMQVFQSAQ